MNAYGLSGVMFSRSHAPLIFILQWMELMCLCGSKRRRELVILDSESKRRRREDSVVCIVFGSRKSNPYLLTRAVQLCVVFRGNSWD